MHWNSFSQMVSQKHCSEPKNGFEGENGGWCIGDALSSRSLSPLIYSNGQNRVSFDVSVPVAQSSSSGQTRLSGNDPDPDPVSDGNCIIIFLFVFFIG